MANKERPILFSAPMVRALLEGRKTQTRRVVKVKFDKKGFIGDNINDYSFSKLVEMPDEFKGNPLNAVFKKGDKCASLYCPHGKPGDSLGVRENFKVTGHEPGSETHTESGMDFYMGAATVQYMADNAVKLHNELDEKADKQAARFIKKNGAVPNIFLPRWASRINLDITGIRVERLQDISEWDAIAEGIIEYEGIVSAYAAGGHHCEVNGIRYYSPTDEDTPYETAAEAFEALWTSINGADSWNSNPWVWVIEFEVRK